MANSFTACLMPIRSKPKAPLAKAAAMEKRKKVRTRPGTQSLDSTPGQEGQRLPVQRWPGNTKCGHEAHLRH